MQQDPTLSIIIPCNNNKGVSDLCLSLQKQKTQEVEIIIVDDGSNPPLKNHLEKFDFKYIYKENSGPGNSRNHGAKLATGKYFLFLDSDLIVPDNMIKKILHKINENNIDVCSIFYSNKSNNNGVGENFKALFDFFHNRLNKTKGFVDSLHGSSCIFEKNVFNDLKGWNSIFIIPSLENEEFASRIVKSKKYKITFFPDLEFHHKFKPTLILLKTIYNRSMLWTNLFLRKEVRFDGLVRTKKTGFLYSQPFLILFFLSLSTIFPFLLYFALISLTIFLYGNLNFYTFILSKKNIINSIKYILFHFIYSTSVNLGALSGFALYYFNKITKNQKLES